MSAKSKLKQESNSLETRPAIPGNILEVLERLEGRLASLEKKFVHLDTGNTIEKGLQSGNGSGSKSDLAISLEDLRQDLDRMLAKFEALGERTDLVQDGLQKVTKSFYIDSERAAWSNFFDFRWGKRSSSYDFEYEMRTDFIDFKSEMRKESIDFRSEMRTDFIDFKSEVRKESRDFRSEMRTDFFDLKTEVRKESIGLRYEVEKEFINFRYYTKAYIREELRCMNKNLSERISKLESKE